MNIRQWVAVAAAFVFVPSVALAGQIHVWAESAQFTSDSDCTRETIQGANRSFAVVRCPSSPVGDTHEFNLPVFIPADEVGVGTWSISIAAQLPAGQETAGDCFWVFSVDAFPNGSSWRGGTTPDFCNCSANFATNNFASGENNDEIRVVSSATPISQICYRELDSGCQACNDTTCDNADALVYVALISPGTTQAYCDFRKLTIEY